LPPENVPVDDFLVFPQRIAADVLKMLANQLCRLRHD
jgi:hypothetical protein